MEAFALFDAMGLVVPGSTRSENRVSAPEADPDPSHPPDASPRQSNMDGAANMILAQRLAAAGNTPEDMAWFLKD